MSLLLLLALQAETPSIAPAVEAARPVVKTPARRPKANPTVIYAPARSATEAATTGESEAAPAPSGLSQAAIDRILAERKANAERQAAHRQELAETQAAVTKALGAEPFDLDALKAALLARDRVTTAYREKLTAAVLAMLDEVPAEERVAVAKAVIQGDAPARTATKPTPKSAPSPDGR